MTVLIPTLFKSFSIKLDEELLGRIMYLYESLILLEDVLMVAEIDFYREP